MNARKGGSLTIYVDCVSPYSWFGFTNTIKFRPLLEAHGVSVDIYPFFLGGARDGAGNPWTPPVLAKIPFGTQDYEMTGQLLGLKPNRPKQFPISSLLPVRVATYVKDHYPASKFDETFPAFSTAYWSKGINISTPEGVAEALEGVFSSDEVEDLLQKALSAENKKRVIDLTMSTGAWGAPWIIATNSKGEKKSWFGNDRWDQIFFHLEVPYTPVRIIPPGEAEGVTKAKI